MKKHVKTIKIFRLRRAKQQQTKENIDFKKAGKKNSTYSKKYKKTLVGAQLDIIVPTSKLNPLNSE